MKSEEKQLGKDYAVSTSSFAHSVYFSYCSLIAIHFSCCFPTASTSAIFPDYIC